MSNNFLRRLFWYLNKFFMVPIFRLGLGSIVGNPITGYIMVLKTVGRKTGFLRYTPVNYAIQNGCIYWVAGFGTVTHWLHNIKANPDVELILPGRAVSGLAEIVTDPEEAFRASWQVHKNAGLPGFFAGFNPYTITPEQFRGKTKQFPVIRLSPTGLANGPFDAGGWFWILLLAVPFAIIILWLR